MNAQNNCVRAKQEVSNQLILIGRHYVSVIHIFVRYHFNNQATVFVA